MMSQNMLTNNQDIISSENSSSTKEFLQFEKSCEVFRDSDEEIKMIFSEIKKLSGEETDHKILEADIEDVDLILKRAEDIAKETENLLKSGTGSAIVIGDVSSKVILGATPVITVTKPINNATCELKKSPIKVNHCAKQNEVEKLEVRRKIKSRPFSAGVIDSKKREATRISKIQSNTTPKKSNPCKHETLIEELKDTNERAKSLELLNVQLTEDNKVLRKKLDQVNEEKHVADLKLAECEKFISRLGKEYENRNRELKNVKENENKILAELHKERNDRKNLTIQRDKDAVVIQDLNRQVKEMEMILKRKHPDSVSALIVASKSSAVDDNKKKLLEERIARLEQELGDKENHFQGILLTLQEKFGDMKQKYENHIIDIERQLMDDRKINMELKNKLNRTTITDSSVQTVAKARHSVGTQTLQKTERASSAVSRLTPNSAIFLNKLKEDSYLVATIKGLQAELTGKQRTIAKINRETEELRKNLRNLHKEKEVLLNLNPQKKVCVKNTKSSENIALRMNNEMEAELIEMRKQKETLLNERCSLLDSLKRTNEDFIMLKKKRIQDLHTLQLAHEKELVQMNMQLYPFQEEIKLLNKTIELLQERVICAEDKLMKCQVFDKDIAYAGGDNSATRPAKKDIR